MGPCMIKRLCLLHGGNGGNGLHHCGGLANTWQDRCGIFAAMAESSPFALLHSVCSRVSWSRMPFKRRMHPLKMRLFAASSLLP